MATDLFRVVIHQKLNEGQLENFLRVTGGLTAMVEANEPDTLAYEFYVSDDGTEAYAVSTFKDSEAFLAHESRAWEAGYCLSAARGRREFAQAQPVVRRGSSLSRVSARAGHNQGHTYDNQRDADDQGCLRRKVAVARERVMSNRDETADREDDA